MSEDVGYIVVNNEKYPDIEKGLSEIAMDVLISGKTVAVILFPKSWNSTVSTALTNPLKLWWRNFLVVGSVFSSTMFAYNCFPNGVVDENGVTSPIILDQLIPLTVVPLLVQLLSMFTEFMYGKLKGLDVTSVIVPTLTISSFGSRSTFLTMPQNRNDMFDVAAGITYDCSLS